MGLFSRKKHRAADADPAGPDPADADTDTDTGAGAGAGQENDGDDSPAVGASSSDARADFVALVDREWERLANAGTWWTGAERLAIAEDARRALAGEELSGILPAPVEEATVRIAAQPATIRGTDVARWELDGLDSFAYVETVGVISRLIALDTVAYGLGLPPRPLPTPEPGLPTKERAPDAAITTGWAPTVGPATAPSSLSAVPREADAMFDLHRVLYLTLDEMFEMQLTRDGLSRPQIELVAARTSCLNDCFY